MAVVVGFVEESSRHRFYNTAIYAEGGRIVHVHHKVYLPTYGLFDEQRYFAAGERIQAFDTARFGRVGILICEDFWHLSAATIMQAEEVDLLICAANSPARGIDGQKVRTAEIYEQLAQTFAQLLGAAVIVVNRVGFEDGLCFWGGSMAIGPDGRTVAQAPMLDEALCVAVFDPAELRRQRLITPLSRDERLLVTIEELNRIKRQRYD
jgi:predicted amidohydrolase